MKNTALADLNFLEIVDYGGQPHVQNRYVQPLKCRGYCVDCEQSGILNATGGRLDLMSHGCDSSDFEAILGPMRRTGPGVAAPVMFLLENPGSDDRYRNGEIIEYGSFRKKPPVHHYYWTPSGRTWPDRVADFVGDADYYGRYFAYLMQRHQLFNVYITNLVKCKWTKLASDRTGSGDASAITQHCAELHLKRELQIFSPRLAICFGGSAERGFREYAPHPPCHVVMLLHPSYIKNRSQTQRRSKEELFEENDQRVENALKRLI